MSKNYMEQVAEMLGLEIGDSFLMIGDEDNKVLTLSEKGIECEAISALSCDLFLRAILTGEIKIKKLPWKPQCDETYYFPQTLCGLSLADEAEWCDTPNDRRRYMAGMVCKTVDEAQEKAKKMLAAIREGN